MTNATAAGLADALADRYALEREPGRGGRATVYLARDLKHGGGSRLSKTGPDTWIAENFEPEARR